MKTRLLSALVFSALLLLFGAVASYAQITFTLKDDSTVTAYSCNDTGASFVCAGESGTFEVMKTDIKSMKEEGAEEAPAGAGEPGAPAGEPEGQQPPAEQPAAGMSLKGATPEQLQRLQEIDKRKAQMQAERKVLIDEQMKLNEDVKNMKTIRTKAELDAVNKRITEIETRISAFNNEVNRLDAEEKKILDAIQAAQ